MPRLTPVMMVSSVLIAATGILMVLVLTGGRLDTMFSMRDGWEYPVQVRGYHSDRLVQAYFQQKCQFGLYQALFRIRPYDRKDYDRHIFVYTNMPIPGVEVDRLLGGEAEGFQAARATLLERLTEHGECTVPDLARLLLGQGERERTVQRYVQRHAEKLAAATGSVYEPGKGKRPGRLMRQA